MICYRDRTYCPFSGNCEQGRTCDRALTDQVRADAQAWWGSEDAPISIFADPPPCYDPTVTQIREPTCS